MGAREIYNALRKEGMSYNGAFALLGNMDCESALRADNAQDGMTRLSDVEYTQKFNTDPTSCFTDSVGYGLCQWTYSVRKKNLWQFAQNWGVGVEAEDMQAAFAVYELKTEYAQLWAYLCGECELYTATSRICCEFERPAINNVSARYSSAMKWEVALKDNFVQEAPIVGNQKPREISVTNRILKVSDVQLWLNSTYGCELVVDNRFGNLTKKGLIVALQKELGTSITGIFSQMDSQKLGLLRVGADNRKVRIIQAMLICKGYFLGVDGADGKYGNNTTAAIYKYQIKSNLVRDGICGPETANKLFT